MGRPSQIRITQNDRKEYAKLVKNSKAKIRRTNKNYGVDLSDEVALPPLDSFQTRKEFNEWKQKQSSFLNKANTHYQFVKNEYGVVANKFTINKIIKETKKAQKNADEINKKLKEKPSFLVSGEQQGTVGQRMLQMSNPDIGVSRPKDFNFKTIRNQRRLKQIEENMQKRSDPKYFNYRTQLMQNNFVDLLRISLNSNADDLITKINQIPADDFYEMYMMFDEFDFDLWDSEGQFIGSDEEARGIVSKMNARVDQYFSGQINFDLKGFPSR